MPSWFVVIRRSWEACEPFSLGYFVGSTSTPNRFYDPRQPHPWPVTIDPRNPAVAEACRVLASCPVCDSAVAVRFDEKHWIMSHICDNVRCALAGSLPIYTIDDDVYRHAPTVLVGTVNKLAQLAQTAASRRCSAKRRVDACHTATRLIRGFARLRVAKASGRGCRQGYQCCGWRSPTSCTCSTRALARSMDCTRAYCRLSVPGWATLRSRSLVLLRR